jgi:hypothetical protein
MEFHKVIALQVLLCVALPAAAEESYPGTTLLPKDDAVIFFAQVCATNIPKINRAHNVLEKEDFWKRPETGTYYHRKYNLSFKITPRDGGTCSMVLGSKDLPDVLAVSFGVAAAMIVNSIDKSAEVGFDPKSNVSRVEFQEGWVFQFEPAGKTDGVPYYHASIIVQPKD